MLALLLLPILFVFQPARQNPSGSDEHSPIVAIQFRWFRDRQAVEKVVVPPRGPQPPTLEANKSVSRNQRTDGTAPERDPQLDKLETRSGSLDAIAQESSESRRVDGFTYEVRFKNFETKQAQTIFWEYQFKETANPQNTSRRRFLCGVKIKPDKETLVQVFTTLGPGSVINLKNLTKGSGKQFDESVVIDRIEYEDGSVWQRKDWNFEEAKLAVRKGGERSGVCRSF
jgi:hypothetical protein